MNMTLLRLQRFMKLTMGKSLLTTSNKRSRSWQKSFRRRAMGGMKKTRIIGTQSSQGSVPRGEKPAVHLPPPPPPPQSLVLPSAVPGRGNSDKTSPSSGTNAHSISIDSSIQLELLPENILAEARGGCCSSVEKKRKISGLQRAKENLKRMKAEVKEQREETNRMRQQLMAETAQMQAAAEGFESALAHGWAENELMMEQNRQDQHLLLLGWIHISDPCR